MVICVYNLEEAEKFTLQSRGSSNNKLEVNRLKKEENKDLHLLLFHVSNFDCI